MEYPFNGIAHPKINFGHYLLTHMLSQTCINFFLVLNTKYDISKNVGNQTVAGPHLIVAKSYRSHCGPATVWFYNFFLNSIYVQPKKKNSLRFKTTSE